MTREEERVRDILEIFAEAQRLGRDRAETAVEKYMRGRADQKASYRQGKRRELNAKQRARAKADPEKERARKARQYRENKERWRAYGIAKRARRAERKAAA